MITSGPPTSFPAPTRTELATHIGHACAGWAGLVIAGVSFIAPATLIVGCAAWFYVMYGALPVVAGVLYGIKPVVIAVVAQALWGLGRTAVKSAWLGLVGLLAAGAVVAGLNELLVLAGAGAAVALRLITRQGSRGVGPRLALIVGAASASAGVPVMSAGAAGAAALAPFGLWPLFLVFAKVGAVLFGSGYVPLTFLRADLVEPLGWLTEPQLLDAIAIGQATPGPVFTTTTFIGYLLGGVPGAGVATVGIFLPAFVFVALSGPLVPRLRRSALAGAVLPRGRRALQLTPSPGPVNRHAAGPLPDCGTLAS